MKKLLFILSIIFISLGNINATNGIMSITATTTKTSFAEHGNYNVLAIWVTDANGTFVKTLLASSKSAYRAYLTNWKAATSSTYNVVDGISTASYSGHAARSAQWDGTNTNKEAMVDGTYYACFEDADNYGHPAIGKFAFEKGRSTVGLTPTASGLLSISVQWVPDFTALDNANTPKLYRAFPNPATDMISIPGAGIQKIRIFSITGALVLEGTDNELNIRSLAKGKYILSVQTLNGTFNQKLIKN